MDHNKLWKALKEMEYQTILPVLRNLYVGQEATVRTLYGTIDWLRIEKDHDRVVCCHSVYLTYMLSTS